MRARPGREGARDRAGTGQATARLLALGADPLVGVEPDPGTAAFLGERFGDRQEPCASSLEGVELESDFGLAVAASSLH